MIQWARRCQATSELRSSSGQFLFLPLELQLRVLEELGGQDLCAVEAACRDLRRLVAGNAYLYQRALMEDFSCVILPISCPSNWKAQYVDMFIRARLETLEKQRRICEALKQRLDELDDLLGDADDVRGVLGAPELLTSEPSLVLAIVGDMEQPLGVTQLSFSRSITIIMVIITIITITTSTHPLRSFDMLAVWEAPGMMSCGTV
ncbi:hypothetical protein VOLCADRAFT_92620 [Volvox carteri f. nagariensis]|uniref:F-box domain-containing protein n=1 Tax=Volvox carteri f. nagariensis TaxID=3068 RepID=D8U045_VOLCA|nr:uncharacterized protein VOLCADRAFT_92620 [Volvox carteri f. nagariensis]EFJ46873.1 hypothetical protein VOLCADRAFT_92620 [Volvox carteri f. nagariensis]|eukprot:XP_002952082.1 hypothetical protein VOLCADRAFT_92620 [Volvox carteri f. nagariensis]